MVESYLLDGNRTPQELNTFAGLYPNANYVLSNNLLTQTETPTHDDLVRSDRAALSTVEQWMADPRFAKLQPQLQQIQTRLSRFVQRANASGS